MTDPRRIAVFLDGPLQGTVLAVPADRPHWDHITSAGDQYIRVVTYRLRDMPLATGQSIAVAWSGPGEHPPADWLLRSIALILKPSAIPELDRARARTKHRFPGDAMSGPHDEPQW